MDRIDLQNKEFDALTELAKQWDRLKMTPVVDDDYAEVRHRYEGALRDFLDATQANGHWKVPKLKTSIIQEWAASLGLRHQGVLVSAIRGCDSVQREDASKYLVRVYRGALLRPHCEDLKKCASFMVPYSTKEWDECIDEFFSSIDHYPNHWILHFTHAAHIIGVYHSKPEYRVAFNMFYLRVCRKFHMQPESREDMDKRLSADEETFRHQQR